MTQTCRIAILMPLTVGAIAVLCTIFVHALTLGATVNYVRYERRQGRVGAGVRIDLAILVLVVFFVFVAHLIEIALWAGVFVICREFPGFQTAFYHSAVTYTTLGNDHLTMTLSWRLLEPLEAADGMLMFGVSTAMVFAVIVRLIQAKYEDLRG